MQAALALLKIDPKLEREKTREGIVILIKVIDDGVLRSVVRPALVEVGGPAVKHLIRALEKEFPSNPSARIAVYSVLGDIGPEAAPWYDDIRVLYRAEIDKAVTESAGAALRKIKK